MAAELRTTIQGEIAMGEQGRLGRAARALKSLLAAVATLCAATAQAAIITTQGTWYGTNGMDGSLRGRDAGGNPVNLLAAGAPNPALKFVYEVDRNLTWLADWDVNGEMRWSVAMNWADTLSYTVSGVVVDDWRLPNAQNGCYALDICLTGEMGHLWYEELGHLGGSATGQNFGPFINLQSGEKWWSGTLDTCGALATTPFAWWVDVPGGLNLSQVCGYADSFQNHAVAVRTGDVFAGSAPEPGSLVLLGVAVAGLAATRRRK